LIDINYFLNPKSNSDLEEKGSPQEMKRALLLESLKGMDLDDWNKKKLKGTVTEPCTPYTPHSATLTPLGSMSYDIQLGTVSYDIITPNSFSPRTRLSSVEESGLFAIRNPRGSTSSTSSSCSTERNSSIDIPSTSLRLIKGLVS
jgi:hypothetical protein